MKLSIYESYGGPALEGRVHEGRSLLILGVDKPHSTLILLIFGPGPLMAGR